MFVVKLWIAAACVLSCASAPESKQQGELGGYAFTYHCALPSDAFCDDGVASETFPVVAVGSTFAVTYNKGKRKEDDVAVTGFAGDHLARVLVDDATGHSIAALEAKKEGLVAIFAGSPGYVFDILHIRVAKPDHIEVSGTVSGASGAISATAGGVSVGLSAATGVVTIRAFPVLPDKTLVAGALPTKWSQTSTDVLRLTGDTTDNLIHADIVAFGTAVLHVEMGSVAADVTVKLEPKK